MADMFHEAAEMLVFLHALKNLVYLLRCSLDNLPGVLMAAALIKAIVEEVVFQYRLFITYSPQRCFRKFPPGIEIAQQLRYGPQLHGDVQEIIDRDVSEWNAALRQRQISRGGLQVHWSKGLDCHDSVSDRRQTGWIVHSSASRMLAPDSLCGRTKRAEELT